MMLGLAIGSNIKKINQIKSNTNIIINNIEKPLYQESKEEIKWKSQF